MVETGMAAVERLIVDSGRACTAQARSSKALWVDNGPAAFGAERMRADVRSGPASRELGPYGWSSRRAARDTDSSQSFKCALVDRWVETAAPEADGR